MAETKKKKHAGKLALLWCAIIMVLGVLIFALFSAFGALRFWQAERTPQGETDLAFTACLLYTSPSPRDQRGSRMPSSA